MSEFNLIYLYFYDITWLRCKFQLLVFEICHFNGEIKKNNNLVSFLVKLAEEKAKIFGPYLFIDICHFRHIIFINGDYWKYIQVNLYKITTCMKNHFQYLKKKKLLPNDLMFSPQEFHWDRHIKLIEYHGTLLPNTSRY